jgi:hypothetical protein
MTIEDKEATQESNLAHTKKHRACRTERTLRYGEELLYNGQKREKI